MDEARRLRRPERENERLLTVVGQQRLELDGRKSLLENKC